MGNEISIRPFISLTVAPFSLTQMHHSCLLASNKEAHLFILNLKDLSQVVSFQKDLVKAFYLALALKKA